MHTVNTNLYQIMILISQIHICVFNRASIYRSNENDDFDTLNELILWQLWDQKSYNLSMKVSNLLGMWSFWKIFFHNLAIYFDSLLLMIFLFKNEGFKWPFEFLRLQRHLCVFNFSNLLFQIVLMVKMIIITGRPWKPFHFLWSICFGLYYAAFSLIYWGAGGTGICKKDRPEDHPTIYVDGMYCDQFIYPILDWENNPLIALAMIGGCIIVFPLLHMFWLGLAKLRELIFNKIYS